MEMKAYLKVNGRVGNEVLESGTEVTVLNPESESDMTRVKIELEDGSTRMALVPKKNLLLDLGNMDWAFELNTAF